MNDKDLYRFLRGLLDVIFMGRKLWRKAHKNRKPVAKKIVPLIPGFRIEDQATKGYVDRDADQTISLRQRQLAGEWPIR
jgi:hypothetical protein